MVLAQTLGEAMALLQSGQLDSAEAVLRRAQAVAPNDPDTLQLMGMLERRKGRDEAAVLLLRASLAARPAQPHVQNNLGNALTALGRRDEAIAAYRAAIALRPDYGDARVNLGLAELAAERADAAVATLSAAVRDNPKAAKGWAALGRALRGANRLDDALGALAQAAALRPGHMPTLHNLAVALQLAGRLDEAQPILEQCAAAAPNAAEVHYNLGHCYHDLGRVDAALAAYERAAMADPGNREMQDTLSRMCWQAGHTDRYLAGYGYALTLRPDDGGLLADLAAKLNLAGRLDESVTLLTDAIGRGIGDAALHHRLGQALDARGDTAAGLAALRTAVSLNGEYDNARLDLARALIAAGEPAAVEDALAPLLARKPYDQQAIAYRGMAWRMAGDPRAHWLNDIDRFVQKRLLTPPPEIGDVASFNARLEALLGGIHDASQRHPIEQTLRGGTQTMGMLFDRTESEIRAIEAMLRDAVANYIRNLPEEADHPFLARRTGGFRFSGSWSVRLRRQGFHVNHVHSEGWISSCYYVGLPPEVNAPEGRQGWIVFGQSSLNLPEGDDPIAAIKPEVGMLVLFPSFLYHGTIPFDGLADRTIIAFDVVPD